MASVLVSLKRVAISVFSPHLDVEFPLLGIGKRWICSSDFPWNFLKFFENSDISIFEISDKLLKGKPMELWSFGTMGFLKNFLWQSYGPMELWNCRISLRFSWRQSYGTMNLWNYMIFQIKERTWNPDLCFEAILPESRQILLIHTEGPPNQFVSSSGERTYWEIWQRLLKATSHSRIESWHT